MIPRIKVGKGVSGAVRYALSEGKDPATGAYRTEPKGDQSRVAWMGGTGFGFEIDSRDDAELARRILEFTAINQTSKTKPCVKDCVHLSLGWRPGEEPTREQMIEAAYLALAALGMENARALFVAHADEPYAHLHIVASKINPDTGRAYDMKGDQIKLSKWAEQYERDHSGGIVCTRREEANQMRDAIDARDAGAVLDLMTQQRATFKGTDLERALSKQIKSQIERAQFAEKVLTQPDAVRLSDQHGGPTTRYTTKGVLEAEELTLRAADALAQDLRHGVEQATRAEILARPEFAGMAPEQYFAFTHATQDAGISLIDGQAGTGKSFTIDAIRKAYEASGYRSIGLAPTNAVAEDMRDSGFGRAATVHSELFALNNDRSRWDDKTLIVVDEAAMLGTKLMAQITAHAQESGAKLILVGDDRQLSSIDRGGMFGVLKDRHNAAELSQVRRQHKPDDKRASELMAEGNFSTALGMYDAKGAIHWTETQQGAHAALIQQWAKDSAADPSKSRFVFAYTNADVDRLNADIRGVRQARGELGAEQRAFETKHGRADFAENDRIQITGTDKSRDLINGQAGTVRGIEADKITVQLDGRDGKTLEFNPQEFDQFRHGYAGTIYKGQGRTLDQTYLYHSEQWRSASSYVALTRHRDKAEMYVARETAPDVATLARQMGRVDDRRAASAFYRDPSAHEPAPAMTAREIAAAYRADIPANGPTPANDPGRTPAASPVAGWAHNGGMVAQQKSATRQFERIARAQPRPRTADNAVARAELSAREERRAWLESQASRDRDEQDRARANDGRQGGGRGGRGRSR